MVVQKNQFLKISEDHIMVDQLYGSTVDGNKKRYLQNRDNFSLLAGIDLEI